MRLLSKTARKARTGVKPDPKGAMTNMKGQGTQNQETLQCLLGRPPILQRLVITQHQYLQKRELQDWQLGITGGLNRANQQLGIPGGRNQTHPRVTKEVRFTHRFHLEMVP